MRMFMRINCFSYAICSLLLGISLLARADNLTAKPGISFSVTGDRGVAYPASIHYLPDEHTTIMPMHGQQAPYYFFVAMANQVGKDRHGDAFVLQSPDLQRFFFAPGFGNPQHFGANFWSPHPAGGSCAYPGVTHFDEQYAAPGSVVQDPTLPPGNFIMIYEAEIHCPPAKKGMAAGWVSVGVARSGDGGKTWPPPVAQRGFEKNWLEYGDGRYAGVTLPGTPPKTVSNQFFGDSLPSAFIDDMDPSGDYYLYLPCQFTGDPSNKADAKIHIARAKIGDHSGHHETGKLHFYKWYRGGWTQEGYGGLEEGIGTPCVPVFGEGGAQIEYNDALGLYMMTFDCTTYVCVNGKCDATKLALYYSTATSLATQDWTTPQPIENSTYPYTPDPQNKGQSIIDGGYPSFMSPGCAPGHIGLSGTVFFLKGDGLGERRFSSRLFTIKRTGATPPMVEGSHPLTNGCKPNAPTGPALKERP